jgi:E3 ubiquitin-protein ligase MYCBP2
MLSDCGHVFHFQCVLNVLKKRWPGPRVTFNFCLCPSCKKWMNHPAIVPEMQKILDLKQEIEKRAVKRLIAEGLDKSEELKPEGKFHKNPEAFAVDKLNYYMCFKCKVPYFAGLRMCDDGNMEYDETELICGSCSGVELKNRCTKHGTEFM